MTEKKTLRLCCPQWQGGVNPNYVFGSELLSVIAPPSGKDKTVVIPVAREFDAPMETVDGIDWGGVLLSQMNSVRQTLEEKRPDRLIVFGGDCSVTQVPFDYLGGRYGGDLGILWLDAHPDISSPDMTSHLHEMPLSNLLGRNPGSEITRVHCPFPAEKVFMAGLIEGRLRPMDQACRDLHLRTASSEALARSSEPVLEWIRETGIRRLAVHWDLDVLSPVDFRSIYPAEPYTDPDAFPAAVGRMKLREVGRLLADVSSAAELVGLSITEHLPWDAFRMRETLAGIPLFQE